MPNEIDEYIRNKISPLVLKGYHYIWWREYHIFENQILKI